MTGQLLTVPTLGRRRGDAAEVVRRDDVPAQFIWRERLHVVRAVLDHWIVTGAWWDSPSVRSISSGDGEAAALSELHLEQLPASPKWGQRAWAEPAPDVGVAAASRPVDGAASDIDDEQEFWRVEAAAGRSSTLAVVDLCFAWTTGRWTVHQLFD